MTGSRPKGSMWVLPVPVSFRFVQCLPRCSAWVLLLRPTQNPVELTLRVGSTPTSGTILFNDLQGFHNPGIVGQDTDCGR